MYSVTRGLATLDGDALMVQELLERRILSWASEIGAARYAFPPLMQVGDLAKFDYFENFPHLVLVASGLRDDAIAQSYGTTASNSIKKVPAPDLNDGSYALPSAACYNAYLHLAGTVQPETTYITTVARCFRNEIEYVGLQRMWGFTMREIVCVGSREATQTHLQEFKRKILGFSKQIGLTLEIQTATDPFYDKKSSRAAMQKVFPVKEEFVYGGKLAIASVNFHRNFFGERCDIRDASGEHVFTSCVAFGLERWLHALSDHFKSDVRAIAAALSAAE